MNHIKRYFSFSPYLSFLPFLAIYTIIVYFRHDDAMIGDEGRYYMFAQHLLKGFYSPPPPNINLWNGPGYPIFLMPFVAFNLPFLCITLCNALFHYFSIILLFKALEKYISFNKTILLSLFWACYYIAIAEMHLILTESFTIFLITGILYWISQAFSKDSLINKTTIGLGITIGYLALTKIIFGYIILVLLAGCFLNYFFKKNRNNKKIFLVMTIAMMTNLPYLFYTYSITHKLFYWGNSGGECLYWMATLGDDELGDWHALVTKDYTDSTKRSYKEKYLFDKEKYILQNHQSDINYIVQFIGVERDDTYKRLAIQNIKARPVKYLRNCVSNVSRLIFNFPFTYDIQSEKMFFRVLPQCILVTIMLVAFILTLWNWQKGIKSEIKFCFIFIILYFAASTIVCAYQRQFYIIVPMILFWVASIFENTLIIHLKKEQTKYD